MRNQPMHTLIILAGALVFSASGVAQDEPPTADAPEPPPLPPKVTRGEQLPPTVTIRTDDEGQVIEEYRHNGQLFMVKVTPNNAPPYYLIDADGDGQFEADMNPTSPIEAVHWKVAEWQ